MNSTKSPEISLHLLFDEISTGIEYLSAVRDDSGAIVDFEFVYSNAAARKLVPPKENIPLIGQRLLEIFPGVKQTTFDDLVKVVETGEPNEEEIFYPYENINRWYHQKIQKFKDGYLITFEDITEKKRGKQLLENIIEGTNDLVAAVDLNYRFLTFNSKYQEAFKAIFSTEVKVGMNLLDALAHEPFHQNRAKEWWSRALQGEEFTVEESFGEAETFRRFEIRFSSIRNKWGHLIGASHIMQDVTEQYKRAIEQKQDQERLRTSEEQWRALIENTPDLIGRIDKNYRFTFFNRKALPHFLGGKEESIIGKKAEDIADEGWKLSKFYEALGNVFQQAKQVEYSWNFSKNGNTVYHQTLLVPEFGADQNVASVLAISRDVTDLRNAKAKFEAIFNQTFQFIGFLNTDGIVLEINDTALQFGGLAKEDVIGKPFWETYWWQISEATQLQLQEAIQQAAKGQFVRYTVEVWGKEKQPVTVDFSLKPIFNERGEVTFLIPEGRDVTEMIELQKALSHKNLIYENLLSNLPFIQTEIDENGILLTSVGGGLEMMGLKQHELEGMQVFDTFPDKRHQLEKAMNGEKVAFVSEFEIDGHVYYHQNFYFFNEIKGKGALGLLVDITELTTAERQLSEMQEFVFLADSLPIIIFSTSPDGKPEYYNKKWFEYTGLSRKEAFSGDNWFEIHPEDEERTRKAWRKALDLKQSYEMEHRLRNAKGEYCWHITRALPMKDEKGDILKWYGSSTEIHQQKQLQKEVEERAAKYAEINRQMVQLMDAMPIVVWTADPDGSVDYFNKKWYEYTGLSNRQSVDLGWSEIIHPSELEKVLELWEGAVKNKTQYFVEYRWRKKNGSYRWHLGRAIPLRDEQGRVTRWIGTGTDIHEQKMIEEQKDAFLHITGHELRTPMTSLLGYLALLRKIPFENEVAREYLQKSYESGLKMRKLLRDFLDFSKVQQENLAFNISEFDFDQLVRETAAAKEVVNAGYSINVRGNTASRIFADKDRIEQVINNLLSNAVKYSPGENTIDVLLESKPESVVFKVKDSGIGMDEDKLNEVFKKFYRGYSREQIRGMGLGLFIVKQIVDFHNGQIKVHSRPNEGTTVVVEIPKIHQSK